MINDPEEFAQVIGKALFISVFGFGLAMFFSKHLLLSICIGAVAGLIVGYLRLPWMVRLILSLAICVTSLQYSEGDNFLSTVVFWVFALAALGAWDSRPRKKDKP